MPYANRKPFLSLGYRNDGADTMRKSTPSISATEVEERFLLQALRRLRTPEQRYVFTLMADLISHGMLADAESGRTVQE